MKPHPGFWQDIVANPDDDTPRLIYADWLDDHDESERAELIRLQCELETLTASSDRYFELQSRGNELKIALDDYSALPELAGINFAPTFSRGFQSLAVLKLGSLSKRAVSNSLKSLFKTTTIRHLHVDGRFAPIRRLFEHPECAELEELTLTINGVPRELAPLFEIANLPRLRSLTLSAPIQDGDLRALARNPTLNSLRSLHFTSGGLTEARIRELTEAPWLNEIQELEIVGWGFDPTAFQILCDAGPFPNLWRLNVNGTIHSPNVLDLLCETDAFPQLTSLSVARINLGSESTQRFANHVPFDLRELNLWYCRIGTEGAQSLASSKRMSSLRSLILGTNRIDAEGAKAIADSEHLRELRHLNLSYNPFGKEGLLALGESAKWPKLRELHFALLGREKAQHQEETSESFIRSLNAPKLRTLKIPGMPLKKAGATALASSQNLSDLRILDLREIGILVNSSRELLRSPNLQQLVSLELGDNYAGAAVEELIDARVMPNLRYLDVRRSHVPKRILNQIRNRIPIVLPEA